VQGKHQVALALVLLQQVRAMTEVLVPTLHLNMVQVVAVVLELLEAMEHHLLEAMAVLAQILILLGQQPHQLE
jgi:hypothetical protein